MIKIAYLAVILFLPLTAYCQKDYLARMLEVGIVPELGVSPGGEVWAATKGGDVFYTKQVGELWHLGPYGSYDPYKSNPGVFERVSFFSEDTLMISGFIHDERKENIVFWSGNHGKTWEKVVFGESSWIDAACVNNNGKAWMSGSSQLIYYTENSGKTWKSFDKVEGKSGNLRFSTIHFAKDEQTGLFGSFWNVLYKTRDNCKSWEKLPTPLDQKKYERSQARPEISKIRIVGDYYIINQQGKIYYTKSDLVDWKLLPNVDDFELTENGELFTINQDLSVSLYDGGFSQIWHSKKTLDRFPRAIQVRNNCLFVLTFENIYKISPDQFISAQLLTDETPIDEPYLKLNYEGEEYGFMDKDILQFDKERKQWFRLMTVDFTISNAVLFDNKMILADESLKQQYVFNSKTKTVKPYNLPRNLFSDLKVTKVVFENGSRGCFHFKRSQETYTRNGNKFVIDSIRKSFGLFPKPILELDVAAIERLIKTVDGSRFSKVSLADLNITENDIREFKLFIDKEKERIIESEEYNFDYHNPYSFFEEEETDFNFYKSVADSLSKLNKDEINNVFGEAYGNFSTTTDWRKITFVFQNGKKVVVENTDDKPNYLYSPWVVDFEGLKFRTNSILLGQQLDEITNGQFFSEFVRDKKYALFKIADYLYRKKREKK